MLSGLAVMNLNDHGAGSLRQAILDADHSTAAQVISFDVAGTIRLTSGALPTITSKVDIDGTTAPGFAAAPVVEIDYNGFAGLQFNRGSAGSQLHSLDLVHASGAGVTLNGVGGMDITGNYIGLGLDGATAAGNQGDGIKLINSSNNVIGGINPVTGVTYNNADSVSTQPVSAWQGIRNSDTAGQYLIAGTSGNDGLLFDGTIDGTTGTSYAVDVPNAATTSVYGPDNLDGNNLRLVGSYKNADASDPSVTVKVNGFLFEGTTADLTDPSDYQTIDYPGAEFNYVHSTMGDLAVGNYDSAAAHGQDGLPLGPGHAYIYDVATSTFLTDIVFPHSLSNTVYGIWYNGGTSYTLCGGYSLDAVNNLDDQNRPIGKAYMVDYDSATGKFSNWTSFSDPAGKNIITHFEGISSVEKGVYTLNADSVQTGTSSPIQGSFVTVRRNADGSFGPANWVKLAYPVSGSTDPVSSNAVYGNQVVGIAVGGGSTFSYQATVNSGFQLSNVISGNGGNGIELSGSNNNQIAQNYIGTNAAGTGDRGNAQNGILITGNSTSNLIGGEATGGNDPTNNVFVRPPLGNLISGNNGDGVLINGKSTQNQLSGNFIGTTASGNAALGNSLDGVAIVGANNNTLLGCTFQQDPFVFYNVISGNGGNGLLVDNSNNTTIQANFFGVGADNHTAVGNSLNGVLIEGSSSQTVMGGPIPLGNVDAANGQNGVYVRDTASYFTSYNTFTGLAAFSLDTHLGNGHDGMLITSTGSNILIRTCVITENGNDGIEIGGSAHGVRVAGDIIGLNTNGLVAMGNVKDGVEIDGNAHDNIIGGPQPTFNVVPRNAISANGAYGVAIDGTAHNNTVSYGYIGLDITGTQDRGNTLAGVHLAAGSYSNTIGSTDPSLLTVISGNTGNGVEMSGTHGNIVMGCYIGTDPTGTTSMSNSGNGIYITGSSNNVIGKTFFGSGMTTSGAANLIAFNGANGVLIQSGTGNSIRGNSISGNTSLGINLAAGANNNQAAPVLTSVTTGASSIQISGTLHSTANTTFSIEFFASDASGASGQFSLGTLTVKTNKAGVATFTFSGALPPSGANFITGTATDSKNNTSEFSPDAS